MTGCRRGDGESRNWSEAINALGEKLSPLVWTFFFCSVAERLRRRRQNGDLGGLGGGGVLKQQTEEAKDATASFA